jgi:hypothetical protein
VRAVVPHQAVSSLVPSDGRNSPIRGIVLSARGAWGINAVSRFGFGDQDMSAKRAMRGTMADILYFEDFVPGRRFVSGMPVPRWPVA